MEEIFVLGVDPGIAITGLAIVKKKNENLELIHYGAIKTSSALTVPERLKDLHRQLTDVLCNFKIDHAAIEKLFFSTNLKTVINVSEARGVILYTLSEFDKEIYEYTPLEAKKSVLGKGNATKKEIQEAVMNIFNLVASPKPDDAADAIALALCHIYSLPYLRSLDDCSR